MIVSTFYDVLYVNIKKKKEVDIDNIYHIADMKSVISNRGEFFILANKCEGTLGCFLLSIKEKEPEEGARYLIHIRSKLEMGDAKMFINEDKDLN